MKFMFKRIVTAALCVAMILTMTCGYFTVSAVYEEEPQNVADTGVYISDLPIKSQNTESVWVNKTYMDSKITVGQKAYEKGVSMHPTSNEIPGEVTYDISGQGFTCFTATVGKDKSSGRDVGGDAGILNTLMSFEVWVDGEKKASSINLPYPYTYSFDVDVTGANEIKLVATHGGDGIYCDMGAFANAILTKGEKPQPVYVSDLPLVSTNINPEHVFFNRTAAGTNVVVGMELYDKGISMHPLSAEVPIAEAVFDISGKGFTRFTATVGKDLSSGPSVAAIYNTCNGFEVWVDGEKKAESGPLPYPYTYEFDVDVTGANEIKLVVTDGGDGIFCDAGSFADPALWTETEEKYEAVSLTTIEPSNDVSKDTGGGIYVNKTWLESKIAVGRNVFDVGISTGPKENGPAEIVYNVEGLGYTKFVATVGKDRTSGLQLPNTDDGIMGSAVAFEVWVDGEIKAESGPLGYPVSYTFCVDIADAKTVKLVLSDGGDSIFCDTGSWANPIFYKEIKEEPTPTPTPTPSDEPTPSEDTTPSTAPSDAPTSAPADPTPGTPSTGDSEFFMGIAAIVIVSAAAIVLLKRRVRG